MPKRFLAPRARRRIALAAALLGAIPATLQASEPARIQYLYTAFLDVPAAFAVTLAECRKVDPASVATLETGFAAWHKAHAAWQPQLRALVLAQLRSQGTPEQVDRMVADLKAAAGRDGPLVARYFPRLAVRPFDCEHVLPDRLGGRDLMINFRDYVQQWGAGQMPDDGLYK
jgi:hypothetical protein